MCLQPLGAWARPRLGSRLPNYHQHYLSFVKDIADYLSLFECPPRSLYEISNNRRKRPVCERRPTDRSHDNFQSAQDLALGSSDRTALRSSNTHCIRKCSLSVYVVCLRYLRGGGKIRCANLRRERIEWRTKRAKIARCICSRDLLSPRSSPKQSEMMNN